jgi:hypothetical protein
LLLTLTSEAATQPCPDGDGGLHRAYALDCLHLRVSRRRVSRRAVARRRILMALAAVGRQTNFSLSSTAYMPPTAEDHVLARCRLVSLFGGLPSTS